MNLFPEKQRLLNELVVRAKHAYPKVFDERLAKGYHHLLANADNSFIDERSYGHLRKFLFAHFFLQKRMENVLNTSEQGNREVFIRFFSVSSRICLALVFSQRHKSEIFNREHVLKAIQAIVPETKEVPESLLAWHSIKHSYLFCYLELEMPSKYHSHVDKKKLEIDLQNYIIYGVTSYCPSVFWPYNYEESYRQLLLLSKEVRTNQELPQISIHFRGQTPLDLEFHIYMVRPLSKESLDVITKKLPPSIRFVSHIHSIYSTSFDSEALAFSIHIPISCLDFSSTINLLTARKYLTLLLEKMFGLFRDFNGGLLTHQEGVFTIFKEAFEDKIPDFSLFAETLFYSLKPLEAQISLNSAQAEILFRAFSSIMKNKSSFYFRHDPQGIFVVKSKSVFLIESLIQKIKIIKNVIYASLQLSGMNYLILQDPSIVHVVSLEKELSCQWIKGVQRLSNDENNIFNEPFFSAAPKLTSPHYENLVLKKGKC